jgi:hypothetical protein
VKRAQIIAKIVKNSREAPWLVGVSPIKKFFYFGFFIFVLPSAMLSKGAIFAEYKH